MVNVGPWEVLLVVAVALILFGPKRLPELAKAFGKAVREFKKSLSGESKKKK